MLEFLPPFAWNAFWCSQILASFAIASDTAAFQFKDRRFILICLIFSSLFLSAHFFLLSQWVAAGITLFSAVRKGFAYFFPGPRWLPLFLLIITIITIYFYQNWYDLLAYFASVLLSVANFSRTDHKMRLWQLSGTSLWLVHNFLVKSPVGMLVELLFLVSNSTGYYRYYLRKK